VVRVIAPAANTLAFAIVLGTAFGVGVCLLVSLAPRWGAASLSRRIAPYVRDVHDVRGYSPIGSAPVTQLDELWRAVRTRFAGLTGSDVSIVRRLRQSGSTMDATTFRGRQLLWAVGGLVFGAVLGVLLVLTGRGGPAVWLVPLLAAAVSFFACDALLGRAARARIARIEDELPTVLEFLALCLSAGEGLLESLRRVSTVGSGDLTAELRGVVVAVGTGSSLSESLGTLSRSLDIPATTRAFEQLIAAIDRGAPLAHVLHAQALDAREDAKRSLIERAGKNEIYMLVPLVLVILPLSVLFAVFPGIFMLRLGIG
jgi:tight adherence protein C